jgi:protease IV
MKNFLKMVLANLTANVIMLCSGFFFIIFLCVVIGMGSGSDAASPSNSILSIAFKGPVLENSNELDEGLFNFKKSENLYLQDIIKAVQKAKADPEIKGISLELSQYEAGYAQTQSLRQVLLDFRASGKFIYTYADAYSQKAYYLAAVAQGIYMHPMGGVELVGLGNETSFYKSLIDKYGVGVDVIRHGKFKAAVEPFLTNEISAENKAQQEKLYGDVWQQIATDIIKNRKLDAQKFNQSVNDLDYLLPENCQAQGITNGLWQGTEYDDFLKKQLKQEKDEYLNSISIADYATSDDEAESSDQNIAILNASGEIGDGESSAGIHDVNLIDNIHQLTDDESIKGVVLRINSPGGSALASDKIFFELEKLKLKKPLVVSFGNVAASGGYYIAMAGSKIYAQPTTITGSIGVFGLLFNLKKAAQNQGINTTVVGTHANSNPYSMLNGASPAFLATMQKSVEGTYQRFVNIVAKSRHKTFEEIDAMAGGRVWSGAEAQKIGLVDEIGDLDKAVADLKKQLKNPDLQTINFPVKQSGFERFMSNFSQEKAAQSFLKYKLGKDYYQLYQQLSQQKTGLQMRLCYDETQF